MTLEEAKQEIPNFKAFKNWCCTRCTANDWYCPRCGNKIYYNLNVCGILKSKEKNSQ